MTTAVMPTHWATSKVQPCALLMLCSRCNEYKLPHEFSVAKRAPKLRFDVTNTGRACRCRVCENARHASAKKSDLRLQMFYGAKHRAKKAGLEFSITLEDIKIPETCPVLGIPIYTSVGSGKGITPKILENSPSLDRIDNSKGYTPDNVKVISLRANVLKKDATLQEIEGIMSYMRSHFPKA